MAAPVLLVALVVPSTALAQDGAFDDLFGTDGRGRVPQSQAEIALSFAPVVRRAAPSVVNIFTERRSRSSRLADDPFFDLFMRPPRMPRVQSSLGSGVVVTKDGLVVTNLHVIEGADSVRIVTDEGRQYPAELVLIDRRSDLAALKLQTQDRFVPIRLADSDAVQIGDLVIAIGNPFGLGQTTTSGIVSGLARARIADTVFGAFIQTDAAINPGNSGGALVDTRGALIGINTAIVSRSGGSNGIGFAVPSGMVRAVMDAVARGETRLRRPFIGARFSALDPATAEAVGLRRTLGALIVSVEPSGPFAKAGVREGDVLLGFDGRAIEHPDAIGYRLATRGIGQSATFSFLSRGKRRDVSITLGPAPELPARDERRIGGRTPFSGTRVANLSPALAAEIEWERSPRGVVVLEVAPRSPARQLGIRAGDLVLEVNGVPITSTRELEKVLEERTGAWRFMLDRDGRRLRRAFRS